MKIPTGNFGNALPQDQGVRQVPDTNASTIAQGVAQLAQTGQQVIMQQQAKDLQEFEKKKAAQERITSLNKLTAAELESDRLGGQIYDRVKRGEIDATAAQAEYSKTWSEFQKTQLADVTDPEHQSLLGAQFGQYRARQYRLFNVGEREAFDAKAKGDFTGLYDNIIQLSIKDPAKAKQKLADALLIAPFAQDEKARIAQRGAQEIDTAQVKYRINQAGDDIEQLKAVQSELRAKGKLTGLQPDAKEGMWASIQSKIDQVGRAAQVQKDQHERAAQQSIANLTKQVQSGGMIDPQVWLDAENATQGTAFAGQVKILRQNAVAIQSFSGQPLSTQADQLRQMEARFKDTSTKDPVAMQQWLKVYKDIHTQNIKKAKDAPLEYMATLTGRAQPPLAFDVLMQPNGAQSLSNQLGERMSAIAAMQKRDGYQVAANPFYPEEVAAIKNVLARVGDEQKLAIMSMLASSARVGDQHDDVLLSGAISAITDDNPALRLAGFAHAQNLRSTMGASVAHLVLQGDRVRKEKTVTLPQDTIIQQEFNSAIAGAVPVGSQMHRDMMHMTQLVYAGLSARDSKIDQAKDVVDEDLFQTAFSLATGGVVDHAGSMVLKPYGMPNDEFDTKLQASLNSAASASGLDASDLDDSPLVPVLNGGEGQYHVSDGQGGVVINPKTKRPLLIEVKR